MPVMTMLKRAALLLVICSLFLGQAAWTQEEEFASIEQLSNWSMYYYRHPEPQKVPAALKYLCNAAFFDSDAAWPMNAFFAAIFEKDVPLMNTVAADIMANGDRNQKAFLANTLWLMNTAESKKLAQQLINDPAFAANEARNKEWVNSEPKDILKTTTQAIQEIDMLWGRFYATGDPEPIKKIIPLLAVGEGGSDNEMLLADTAKWSLEVNALEHEKVYEICVDELKASAAPENKFLKELIGDVEKEKAKAAPSAQ